MSVETIPTSFRYVCDSEHCTREHVQTGSDGHYLNSCPPGWRRLVVFGSGADKTLNICDHCVIAVGPPGSQREVAPVPPVVAEAP